MPNGMLVKCEQMRIESPGSRAGSFSALIRRGILGIRRFREAVGDLIVEDHVEQ